MLSEANPLRLQAKRPQGHGFFGGFSVEGVSSRILSNIAWMKVAVRLKKNTTVRCFGTHERELAGEQLNCSPLANSSSSAGV